MDPVTVLLADDHPLYREGLVRAIDEDPGLLLVAVAADGPSALALTEELNPDVALLDIKMPGIDGLAICGRLSRRDPPLRTRMVLLSAYLDPMLVSRAVRDGAAGYLLKESPRAAICRAVHEVAAGGSELAGAQLRAAAISIGLGA